MPRWTRRRTLQNAGIAGAALSVAGCAVDPEEILEQIDLSQYPPLPDDLPEYSYSGTPGPETLFSHGVASGDPLPDAVILWTKVTPASDGPVEVFWEMALDDGFKYRVAAGTLSTDGSRYHTVKHDATGLIWGRKYFYRFHALGRTSPVGRTKLAPKVGDGTEALRVAFCSCSNHADAYFHAYRWLAGRRDVDVVLHLGDYIYEYGKDGYGSLRTPDPEHEIVTLDDYRRRYAQYRSDPDLQAVHQWHPFVCVWDDHETANNSWQDGAENHDPDSEGTWEDRVAAALQAWLEWLPVRESAQTDEGRIYRTLRYGDLADIYMLDTRVIGRDKQDPSEEAREDQARQLLGEQQEAWLAGEVAAGKGRWQLFGQQIMFGRWYLINNEDAWDGYPGARQRFFDIWENNKPAGSNFVVLTGDIHMSFAQELGRDPLPESWNPARDSLGVEFVCPGIGSTGIPSQAAAEPMAQGLLDQTPHLKWCNLWQRGYVVLDITAERTQADWFLLDGVKADEGNESWEAGAVVKHGSGVLTLTDAPAPDRKA
jgi:alkaline phosphatase D